MGEGYNTDKRIYDIIDNSDKNLDMVAIIFKVRPLPVEYVGEVLHKMEEAGMIVRKEGSSLGSMYYKIIDVYKSCL